ncbi:hypothetical protein CPB86DRAFT_857388, partial [Serendipita vermifera]
MREPMLCLAVASWYKLNELTRLALRHLIRCPLSELTCSTHIRNEVLAHLYALRSTRVQWLTNAIFNLQTTTRHKSGCQFRRENNPMTWPQRATHAVAVEPRWSVVTRAYRERTICHCPESTRWAYWDKQARRIE